VYKKYLLIAVVIALGVVANAQMNAVRRWNPRRVPVDSTFAGDKSCGECHKKQFASANNSGMAQAMEPVSGSKILADNPKLKMTVGPYTYEITRNGKASSYSVTDGKDTISFPLVHAFGQGKMGQTYVLERDGKFYESLVSFYNEPKALDFTIGAPGIWIMRTQLCSRCPKALCATAPPVPAPATFSGRDRAARAVRREPSPAAPCGRAQRERKRSSVSFRQET